MAFKPIVNAELSDACFTSSKAKPSEIMNIQNDI